MKAKNRIAACILCLLAALALCLPARADYHYASHEGSNEYPYTSWETAAELIQDAVDAASPHDTVYVGVGEWYQYVEAEMYDSVSIIGMGIDNTFCHYDSIHGNIFNVDYGCSVEEITFTGANFGACIFANLYAGVNIENCRFLNSTNGVVAAGFPVSISNCIFDSCAEAINAPVWVGDFYVYNNIVLNCYDDYAMRLWVDHAVVQNNIIIGRSGWAIVCDAYSPVLNNNVVINRFHGMNVNPNKKFNNTIIAEYGWGIYTHGVDTLFNNSITNSMRGIYAHGGPIINYNNLWNNDIDIYLEPTDSTGNIFYDPMYMSEDNFHLQAFSPLIDAGDPDILDVDGTRSDIGCYGGPGGCSYTYLDLAPLIPDSINATIDTNVVTLIWHMNEEADFNRYQVFRDTVPGFEPTIFDIIAEPDTSHYADSDIIQGAPYYYRLTSVDNQGNISDYSEEVAVIPTYTPGFVDDGLPKYTVIESAYPNPANSNVTIVYSASNLGPQPPEVKLKIFDIQGRIVKTLVDEKKPAGTYRVVWDGANDQGELVASGTYIVKVFQWGMSKGDYPVRITLIK